MKSWRKAYKELLEWKEKYADKYSVLLEGARRVGKSTIAEQFALNEYKSYIPKKLYDAMYKYEVEIND